MTDIVQLQTFLNRSDIPIAKEKPKTYLSIAKQPHYENVLSNIYAFYFDTNGEHNLGNLFIQSLLGLISGSNIVKGDSKKVLEEFCDFDCDTEYSTDKNGRIDLLLSNDKNAIIIENKVYHHLNNDLSDYWNSIKLNENNKIGLVMSLHPISDIHHKHFVNITHLDFLNAVMTNLGSYLMEANEKFIVFLKDLVQNITNLSKSQMEEEYLKFYFDNQDKINQINQFNEHVRTHIIDEVEKAGKSIDGLNLYGPRASSENGKRVRYYLSQKNRDLMITVIFDEILINKTLKIIVEFMNSCLVNREKYKEVIFDESESELLISQFYLNIFL